MTFKHRIPEIEISTPEVVIATPISPSKIEIRALKSGTSGLTVYDEQRKPSEWTINVMPDLKKLKLEIKNEFPSADVKPWPRNGTLVLSGKAKNANLPSILAFVSDRCKLPIENQIQGQGKMIAIKIRVYEISKKKFQQLGVDWHKLPSIKKKPTCVADILTRKIGKDGRMQISTNVDPAFQAFMESLERHAIAKLIDQPVLLTEPGRAAEFLSGGEIPIKVQNEEGQETIEFRPLGTQIRTTCNIGESGEVTMEISAERSELAEDLSGDTGIPGFRIRRINTGVKLAFGETVALVGDFDRLDKDGNTEANEVLFLLTPKLIEKNNPAEFIR